MEDGAEIQVQSLPFDIQTGRGDLPAFHLATIEQNHIRKILHYTNGNKAETARLLDIGLATLYRKIEEYGLK